MSLDLASLGVSAVDVATIQQNVINQVKQSKKNTLNKELENLQSNMQDLKKQIKKIGRILRNAKEKNINLSAKEIKSSLKKQKQLATKLQTKIQTKTQILNQLKLINQTITDNNNDNDNHSTPNNSPSPSPKRGRKRSYDEIKCNVPEHSNHINNNNNSKTNQWQCTRCTLLNISTNIRCSICNTIRPRNLNLPSEQSTAAICTAPPHKKQKTNSKTQPIAIYQPYIHDSDDADDRAYQSRLESFHKFKSELNTQRALNANTDNTDKSENDMDHKQQTTNSVIPETFYDDSLGYIDILSKKTFSSTHNASEINNCVPLWLYNHLYQFQRVGLRWLHKLYRGEVGGILGDDMGLGKTIQIISFLEGLRVSAKGKGPALVVCPGSVLIQWMRECHKWAPELRVMLLHNCGRHKATNKEIIAKLHEVCLLNMDNKYVDYCGGLIITTYASLKLNDALLLPIKWGIVVLDEGHKIRNPNAGVTMICKQLKCRHRYILSGSPLQNTLMDLWSLFDFIFPGKLATLPVFEEEFVIPIKMGGYTHCTALQIEESIATADILKDIIRPYILRRTKENVKKYFFIPNKTEQVLFCKLSERQLKEYKHILNSNEMKKVIENKRNQSCFYDKYDRNDRAQTKGYTFKVITMLKKICNHSDLLLLKNGIKCEAVNDYGAIERSGKLQVLNVILSSWQDIGHKALIFCQTKQFLDIVEKFIKSQEYIYSRLDGSTPIRNRQNMINRFNDTNSDIFILLLTTRAGGLGINLCGANRVIVMDPDWNPATDAQARERCYRIGQLKDVVVYRLITKGTIEEKVYHRQIYKQFLTNKVLKDGSNQILFNEKDLKDLFSLQLDIDNDNINETNEMFSDLNANISNQSEVDNDRKEEGEILSLLFSNNGIASAFRHNHVENLEENERIKLEKIAKKAAKKALATLEKEGMKINNNNSITQPTWTGSNGCNHNLINDNQKIKKFGNHRDLIHILRAKLDKKKQDNHVSNNGPLSSASLLAQIKARKVTDNKNENRNKKKVINLEEKRYELLVYDLYNFVRNGNNGNGIVSDIIIQHFDHRLKNEKEQCIFKIILQKMCKLIVNQQSLKCWILKDKYQSLSLE